MGLVVSIIYLFILKTQKFTKETVLTQETKQKKRNKNKKRPKNYIKRTRDQGNQMGSTTIDVNYKSF